MTIVVTCGPAWEPLDGMRRLTNASTGRLGSRLADALASAGHRVIVFRGDGSTAALPTQVRDVRSFSTNDDLRRVLFALAGQENIDVVLHAAALCDFRVRRVLDAHDRELREAKISTRSGAIRLELEPATKVLPQLRDAFPKSRLVGWKYELNGTRDDALSAAWRQLREAHTDACVLNGAAWGDGFAWCEPPGVVVPCPDDAALAARITDWLSTDLPNQHDSGP